MRTSSTSEASHAAASRLAARGADAIQHMQATVDLAKQMLASRKSEPVQTDAARTGSAEPDSSAAEASQPPPKPRVFLTTVSELVQVQGHTLHFAAGLARRESGFRSQLARDWGLALAKGAHIQCGLSTFPFADLMMPNPVRNLLERSESGTDAPASLHYTCRLHGDFCPAMLRVENTPS